MNSGKIKYIIDRAYDFYMPQVRLEIESLVYFLLERQIEGVLEIGTKYGGTFFIWNNLFKRCYSVDMIDGIHGGITKEQFEARNYLFSTLFNHCYFVEGDSHSHLIRSTVQGLIKDPVDFLFIDGDHTYEGVKLDYKMYSPLVKKGGWIGFHDINDSQRHRDRDVHVYKFWQELSGNKIEFNAHQDWAGIGIIENK